MIRVPRAEEPMILGLKKAEWLAKLNARRVATPKARPESKQYAHGDVVASLEAMSHGKCFYCESMGSLSVDHYIEVAERADLAFTWENLYLACAACQRKEPNTSIPVTACVDPCGEHDPADHLRFDAEYLRFRTLRGEQTVRKYRLGNELRVSERRRLLQLFNQELLRLTETKSRQGLTDEERARLLCFGEVDAPFSLMFRAYLAALQLAVPSPSASTPSASRSLPDPE